MLYKNKVKAFKSEYINNVFLLNKTASTNDYAKKEEVKLNSLIIANKQTAGKGRREKSFYSPKGGLYFSYKFLPDNFSPAKITMAAAVAVANALNDLYNLDAKIKWVNDVYLSNKKVCGILAESEFDQNGKLKYVVLGIGINIKKQDFNSIDAPVTALESEGVKKVNKYFLTNIIINNFNKIFHTDFIKKYKELSIFSGNTVTVTDLKGNTFTATVKDITEKGELLIIKDGKEIAINYGEVSIKI